MKRVGVALLFLVAAIAAVAIIAVLHNNTTRQERASALAAEACHLRTDAARRRYVRTHSSAAHISFVEALTDMYAQCPGRTPKPAPSAFHPRSSPRPSEPHHRHPAVTKKGESDEKDDGGD